MLVAKLSEKDSGFAQKREKRNYRQIKIASGFSQHCEGATGGFSAIK